MITVLAQTDRHLLQPLTTKGITVQVHPSAHTLFFENIYGAHTDQRRQRVLQTANAITGQQVANIEASVYHLGPLLAGDIGLDVVEALCRKGRVSADAQGWLRRVEGQSVVPYTWKHKEAMLACIHTLKVNEHEMEVLTGTSDVKSAALQIAGYGVQEVVITLGSRGAVIYDGDTFYTIPAFVPVAETDATGCGDTFMAGYLYKRINNAGIQEAGSFGAAMASIKLAHTGPFNGSESDVLKMMQANYC